MFNYFQTSMQAKWREKHNIEPPPTDWRWDLECSQPDQAHLLAGTGNRTPQCPHSFAYVLVEYQTVPALRMSCSLSVWGAVSTLHVDVGLIGRS
jgi:hypothetical protein